MPCIQPVHNTQHNRRHQTQHDTIRDESIPLKRNQAHLANYQPTIHYQLYSCTVFTRAKQTNQIKAKQLETARDARLSLVQD